MTRKNLMLIALAVLLAGGSFYLNKDWFAKGDIQISHRSRPMRATFFRRSRPNDSQVTPIMFLLNHSLRLTSLKVVPISATLTNAHPHPIWFLTSDSNSIPTKTFYYGQPIKGMRPDVKGATPDPLEPGVQYRLLLEAGPAKLQHDFAPDVKTP
jgi:hypothetical protein